MTVADLRRRLTGEEYTLWIAFYKREAEEQKRRMEAAKQKRG